MSKKLYIGNLSYDLTNDELNAAFAACGQVISAKIITDRDTGRSKGFAFVEMADEEGARNATAQLDGKDLKGRPLRVSEAKPQAPRTGGFGGGGDRPRSSGGYGGGGDRGGDRGGFGGGGDRWGNAPADVPAEGKRGGFSGGNRGGKDRDRNRGGWDD